MHICCQSARANLYLLKAGLRDWSITTSSVILCQVFFSSMVIFLPVSFLKTGNQNKTEVVHSTPLKHP